MTLPQWLCLLTALLSLDAGFVVWILWLVGGAGG